MCICPRCGSFIDAGEPYCPDCGYMGSDEINQDEDTINIDGGSIPRMKWKKF